MEFLSKKNEISSDEILRTLEKNVAILRVENHHSIRISCELEAKLEWFNEISRGLANKLDSLYNLAEAKHPIGNEIKHFADQISNSWICVTRQIWEKYSKIRMASRTMHGVPLSLLLDKIKKETILIKVSLQIHESAYNNEHVEKGFKLITEIEELLNNLEKCDNKLQQYLSISKIAPHLVKLECAVTKFVTNVQILSVRKSATSELYVFSTVVKLLTGELLGHEPVNPNHVLAENAPRKPVFIIKNIKRRTDSSMLSDVKLAKNTKCIYSQ